MLFSSIPFLYYFLPVTAVLYFVLLRMPSASMDLKNGWLLAASLFFYAWGEPRHVLLMTTSILLGYLSGIWMEAVISRAGKDTGGSKVRDRQAKWTLALCILMQLGLLAYFKYADFFIRNLNGLTGSSLPLLRLKLPIGISFYTFQMLSYLADVYRGEVPAQRSLIRLALYISMFPQLIAGPIVRYSEMAGQLENRTHSLDDFAWGIRRFVLGLSKKVLFANVLGELCEAFKTSGDKAILFYWIYAAALALHIYFDFSGYSDMAIGLGRIFGFRFPENFDYPYIAGSITGFWRRWHISLGVWFRDYVYIPLGGSRAGRLKGIINILTVWMLTGFWHGAAWNFILWGLFFAVLLILEKTGLMKYPGKGRLLSHVYVIAAVMISFVIFDAADLKEAAACLAGMFGAGELPAVSVECIYYLKSYRVVLLAAAVGATPLCSRLTERMRRSAVGERLLNLLDPAVLAALLLLSTAYLVDGSFNPFLYFRF